ncbi:hypothetical protein GCM10023340_17840 [Nocardioides marinquilinus]|uniref:Uncharacterized protein n=1 Tax=Nocardioides marinquilinus TaxID=1210400 RepID=A0ABP9PHG1_9ACTN
MRRIPLLCAALVGATFAVPAVGGTTGLAPAASAADAVWTPVSARLGAERSADGDRRRVEPRRYAAFTLDQSALETRLDRAPAEGARAAGTVLTVPAPTGDLVDFTIAESPIMEPGLAADHPEIATYAGRSVDGAATIRLDVTPMGFHASVRGDGASWFVDPAYNGDADGVYLSYVGTDLPAAQKKLVEPESMTDQLAEAARDVAPRTGEPQDSPVTFRTYRLALVTDPSYARYFGTQNVLAEKVTLMNRVNQIYNDDFAVRLDLVDGTDKLNIDTDAKAFGPDGGCGSAGCYLPNQFANGCTGGLLNRNRIAIGQLIGASNYDIGHIALGINGGGVAGLGVVGADGKARGCTGLPQPEGDFMAIDYVAHEMGHQFGGNHTFNGTQVSCGGNKAAPSVEPGSGSSVMAYAGICGQDDLQPHTDPYFSQWSQQEMTAYITAIRPLVNEVQTVALNGFDTDGESFTLSFRGRTSAPIVRGTNYTLEGIDAALEAILVGGQVSVAGFGNSATLDDTGFQLVFNTPTGATTPNPLAGQDLPSVSINPVEGFTGFVGETAQGGPAENGGFTATETTNRTPVATAPATASIPLRTPFTLTGEASDADGDAMVYLWEQTDRGAGTGTSLVSQTKTNGPLFRVFGTYANVTPAATLQYNSPGENEATASPSRTFPDMEQILVNNTNAATGLCPEPPAPPASGPSNVPVPTRDCFSEWLPTADYVGSPQAGNEEPSLNFRFTARDLDPTAGGYSFANTKVTIDKTAGPFLVSSKNNPAAAVAGRTEVVAWAVAGTNKPTLAENVKISLSTDGGRTFPIVLAESTPNDGSEPVTWPAVETTTARIKVEAVGNVFFDVNNADFQITVPTPPTPGDTTAPETTIVSGPDAVLLDTATTVDVGTADDDAAGYACTLDGAPVACDGGTAELTGLGAGTHRFTATATDAAGNTDASPATRVFTVPVDDRVLRRAGGGWQATSASGAFLGTISTTRTKGAALQRPVTGATEMWLVAGTGPASGSVRVLIDGTAVRTIDLRGTGSTPGKQLFRITGPGAARSGLVRIEKLDGRPVKIDGLAVVTAPAARR